MKRFEAFLGNGWQGWEVSETCSMKKVGQKVIITTTVPEQTFETTFNLTIIPAYTIG